MSVILRCDICCDEVKLNDRLCRMTLTYKQRFVVSQLVEHMAACRRQGVSFADCLAEARKQFAREVNEQALKAELPK